MTQISHNFSFFWAELPLTVYRKHWLKGLLCKIYKLVLFYPLCVYKLYINHFYMIESDNTTRGKYFANRRHKCAGRVPKKCQISLEFLTTECLFMAWKQIWKGITYIDISSESLAKYIWSSKKKGEIRKLRSGRVQSF